MAWWCYVLLVMWPDCGVVVWHDDGVVVVVVLWLTYCPGKVCLHMSIFIYSDNC